MSAKMSSNRSFIVIQREEITKKYKDERFVSTGIFLRKKIPENYEMAFIEIRTHRNIFAEFAILRNQIYL